MPPAGTHQLLNGPAIGKQSDLIRGLGSDLRQESASSTP